MPRRLRLSDALTLPADLQLGDRRLRITHEHTLDGWRYIVRCMFHNRTGRRFLSLTQAVSFAERWLRGETK